MVINPTITLPFLTKQHNHRCIRLDDEFIQSKRLLARSGLDDTEQLDVIMYIFEYIIIGYRQIYITKEPLLDTIKYSLGEDGLYIEDEILSTLIPYILEAVSRNVPTDTDFELTLWDIDVEHISKITLYLCEYDKLEELTNMEVIVHDGY